MSLGKHDSLNNLFSKISLCHTSPWHKKKQQSNVFRHISKCNDAWNWVCITRSACIHILESVNLRLMFKSIFLLFCRLPFVQDVEYGNTTHLGDCDGEFVNLFGMWPLAFLSTFSAYLLPRENNFATLQQYRKDLVWFESFAQAVKVTRKSQVASGEMEEDNERETEPWVFSF